MALVIPVELFGEPIEKKDLTGVWEAKISPTGVPPPPIRALSMFLKDGSFVGTLSKLREGDSRGVKVGFSLPMATTVHRDHAPAREVPSRTEGLRDVGAHTVLKHKRQAFANGSVVEEFPVEINRGHETTPLTVSPGSSADS